LLRLLRHAEQGDAPTPRVLGVDDFALRRGCRYGTILVDMENHRPIDLLDDREAGTLAGWLRDHPGVEIIVRDRAGAYAEGARAGAPDALQVADRFHLLLNASTALEELLRSRRRRTEWVPDPSPPPDDTPPPDEPIAEPPATPSPTQRQRAERRARRIARWEEIRSRRAAGQNISQIARAVGKDRKTVRRYLATPAPPPAPYVVKPRPAGLSSPTLQPFVSYLQDRWQAGCTNVRRLYGELTLRGYTGSYSLLRGALRPWRPPRPDRVYGPRHRRSIRWLCLRPKEKLTKEELAVRDRVLSEDPELARGCELLEQFHELVRRRDQPGLDGWIATVQESGLAPFQSLANGLQRDRAAVDAAFTTEWSNGLVEGQVNRLKLIKRQGYGRAKTDLLRRRVLAA
jgi:transposase